MLALTPEIKNLVWGREIWLQPAALEIPLLLKIIQPRQDLSVQVHPDDMYAQRTRPTARGKTEAWYITAAPTEGKIYHGLKDGIEPATLAAAIKNNTVVDCLREVKVKVGDVIFIPAGTVHALCGGVDIIEIQQNSDITYRVYDWGRVGDDGKPRPLHLTDALAVIHFGKQPAIRHSPKVTEDFVCRVARALTCDQFTLEILDDFRDAYRTNTGEQLHILFTLDGAATVTTATEKSGLTAGKALLINDKHTAYTIAAADNRPLKMLRFIG